MPADAPAGCNNAMRKNLYLGATRTCASVPVPVSARPIRSASIVCSLDENVSNPTMKCKEYFRGLTSFSTEVSGAPDDRRLARCACAGFAYVKAAMASCRRFSSSPSIPAPSAHLDTKDACSRHDQRQRTRIVPMRERTPDGLTEHTDINEACMGNATSFSARSLPALFLDFLPALWTFSPLSFLGRTTPALPTRTVGTLMPMVAP